MKLFSKTLKQIALIADDLTLFDALILTCKKIFRIIKKYIYFLMAVTGTVLLFSLSALQDANTLPLKDKLSLLILFWTLTAILWYSKETQELKEASIKRPCISLYKKTEEENGASVTKIKIKNYGDGVARDVKLKINDQIKFSVPLLSSGSALVALTGDMVAEDAEITYCNATSDVKYKSIVLKDDSPENTDGFLLIDYKW